MPIVRSSSGMMRRQESQADGHSSVSHLSSTSSNRMLAHQFQTMNMNGYGTSTRMPANSGGWPNQQSKQVHILFSNEIRLKQSHFKKERFGLNFLTPQNASKFAMYIANPSIFFVFHFVLLYFFPNECPVHVDISRPGHSLGKK